MSFKSWWFRKEPSVEARVLKYEADEATKPKYYPRSNTDGGNYSELGGKIRLTVQRQHPGSKSSGRRPDEGTILKKDGGEEDVVITGRGITRTRVKGRWVGTAFGGVQVYTRKRSKR